MSQHDPPPNLADAMVNLPIHCGGCGYTLYGLPAAGDCPECGLELWQTILHTVDPAASRLPKLRNPKAIGNGLAWLTFCLLLSATLFSVRPLALQFGTLPWTRLLSSPSVDVWAGAISLAGWWSIRRFAPPRHAAAATGVTQHLVLLGIGLTAWSLVAGLRSILPILAPPGVASSIGLAYVAVAGAAAVTTFVSVDRVLRTIGARSRAYRTARGGRQGAQAMIGAVVVAVVGQAIGMLAASSGRQSLAQWAGFATWAAMIMLLIGLSYLLANAWWIRRSLRQPPPTLGELLATPDAIGD